MFIDGIPILIIAVPLLVPIAQKLGVNLVHLGSVIVFNVGLGVVTPPYAISIFVGTRLANVPYGVLVRPMMIYLFLVGIPALLLTTYIPWLSLWLPTLIMGRQVVGVVRTDVREDRTKRRCLPSHARSAVGAVDGPRSNRLQRRGRW